MDKRFWGFLAVVVVVFTGIFIFTNHKKAAAPGTTTVNASAGLTNHVKGNGSTNVTLTEYGDYECPACGQYFPVVNQVYATYKDKIRFQFRNFPLYQIHPNAIAGARAAEAADLQGKYWEMHDLLYTNQKDWGQQQDPTPFFKQYADQLGLDTTRFQNDFKSSLANNRIQADLKEGTKLGVDSTPTFFIDGKKISNPQSLDAFNKVIDNAIQQKTGQKPAAAAPTPTPVQTTNP